MKEHIEEIPELVLKVFETVPDRYLILSKELIIKAASESYLLATNANRKKIIGKHLFEVFPEKREGDSVENLYYSLVQVIKLKSIHSIKLKGYDFTQHEKLKNSNEEKYWKSINTPILNESGEILYIIHKIEDATDEWKLQSRIELLNHQFEFSQRLVSIFMDAPIGVAILRGEQLQIEIVNPSLSEMLGRKIEDVISKPLFSALPELSGQGLEAVIDRVYSSGKEFANTEIPTQILRNGQLEVVYFDMVFQPLKNETGNIEGIVIVANEVTKQKLYQQSLQVTTQELATVNQQLASANEKLATSNEQLINLNKTLGASNEQLTRINSDMDNFIYAASHDLKAPIANIEGLINALIRNLPVEILQSNNIHVLLQMMQAAIERFRRTIADLTEITKLEKESNQPPELVEVKELIESIISDFHEERQKTNAQIQLDISADFTLNFPVKNLKSVFYNLISNAIKYSSPERRPKIKITLSSEPDFTLVSVIDNGLGLSPDDISKIFGMFKRLHTHVDGSGIGLYIVKKIIENAGGKIEVESELNVGTTFKIYFLNS